MLPSLREEIDLMAGPMLSDGQPSWTLHDPVRNAFFRIDWLTFEILNRWGLGTPEAIAQSVCNETTLLIGVEDVAEVLQFLSQNQLVQPQLGTSAQQAQTLNNLQGTWWKWLLHHYLFFRIPLWKPDDWLTRWLPVARWFSGASFLTLTGVAFLWGFTQVARRWDEYVATLVDTFTWSGLLSYGFALLAVKWIHELGHAFAAKRYGCKVPTMGVAFLVMWPMAYTDTNEAWRLVNKQHRLKVSSAGIATELVVAVWATVLWSLLPIGGLQTAAFFLATTSWVATLAINASPFMRFDGYFILMDALDMPNLHGRGFAMARWKLREILFGLGEEPPEYFETFKQRLLIAFAIATMLYRLFLFIGIALLVYHQFFKLLGVFLFLIEIIWFVFFPIRSEIKEWSKRWPQIRRQVRSRSTVWVLMMALLSVLIPWPTRQSASALLTPSEMISVYAPSGSRIEKLPFKHGDSIKTGQALVLLWVPDLLYKKKTLQVKLEQQSWQSGRSAFDTEMRKRQLVSHQELQTVAAELKSIESELLRFQPVAQYDGIWLDQSPDLREGQWVKSREKLGTLVKSNSVWRVEAWFEESVVPNVRVGDKAYFVADSGVGSLLALRVSGIDQDATRVMPKPELTTTAGGSVLVRSVQDQWIPEVAVYKVTFELVDQQWQSPQINLRGTVVVHGAWSVPFSNFAKQVMSVLVREFGF